MWDFPLTLLNVKPHHQRYHADEDAHARSVPHQQLEEEVFGGDSMTS